MQLLAKYFIENTETELQSFKITSTSVGTSGFGQIAFF